MESQSLDYSVIIPVFNSSELVIELYEELEIVFTKIQKSFEVIFVDDSGNNQTWPYLVELKKKYSTASITAIQLARNYGQHNATVCGLRQSRGEWMITMDDDLQVMPISIINLIEQQKVLNAEVVSGILQDKEHTAIKQAGSWLVKLLHSTFFNEKRTESSFRLINRKVVAAICQHEESFIYIDNVINWYTQHIDFVAVPHLKSRKGKSSYSLLQMIGLFFNLVFNYTVIPLKIMTYGGLFFSIITGTYGGFILLKKMILGAAKAPMGYSTIIVTILFSTSLLLFGMGVLGEYIRRIYISLNKQPQFRIKQLLK